ncbi:MAG: peptidase M24 [Sphaerochaetaceae bacterium]|jgi:Xaa-Pro aminopeptidase|nr:aminopeptidase P family N-terminal domain-containing protein [Sphaerochaetaceae bacterium]MDD4260226.1 aminopeptidase P family N-terminal domain-containing protein [Sphaerochaetaceae bacterium]MDD4763400.1 aminopeptidase P family N-terminal domain-containing protein [Sphaerochaetaceae bacterium]MDD4841547.1 aminopeptidase P family N-terminal domain-containing protein [Sphaerochaetaceae bacterium]NLO61200.1 peptidase M24 [Spirochaetales bacterium]
MKELETKLTQLRSLLAAQHLDAIYLKRQDNFAWLTCGGKNWVGIGEMGNCGLLVTHDATHAITNVIESARMRDEEHLEAMGFTIHAGTWHDNGFEAATINRLVPNKTVGYDWANGSNANVANHIKQLRLSFTEEEVIRYKEIGYLASLAIEETAMSIRPGDTEYETVGRLSEILHAQGMDFASAMCASDERICDYRHPVPTMKKIRERVQLGGNMRRQGLVVCLTRYVNFVPVDRSLMAQYRANVEIDLAYMTNTIVGKSYQHALLAGQAAYEKLGYREEFDKHHQGGPIGYNPREYRVDFSHDILVVENQGFCWNPSITGTKSEDTILVTSKGFEFISRPVIYPTIEVTYDGKNYTRADILQK